MTTKFFNNEGKNRLIDKFEEVFQDLLGLEYFDAMVGYFRASGYFKLRKFLDKIPHIRILVGINVDKITQKFYEQGRQYIGSEVEIRDEFIASLIGDIKDAPYDKETEEGIIQFINDIIDGKIEIRASGDRKIHAKIYIFRQKKFTPSASCRVITGSSNLTDSGLGTIQTSNYEFNVELRDYDDVKFAYDEFERLWNTAKPILPADATKVKKSTHIDPELCTPFELYIKFLIEYFGKRIEYNPENIDMLMPNRYTRLAYQMEAALEGYDKIKKYNGVFLADVVGLGKTVIACMIVKKFIYENGQRTRILLVCPPALVNSWRRATEDFQIEKNFDFITTGSLHKVLDKENRVHDDPEEIDMVIVDEAHKFRNDATIQYRLLQTITKTDRQNPGIDGDKLKKVLLLSATPLNNRPEDIQNQIYLFQNKRNSTLPKVKDLQRFFKPLNDEYKRIKLELAEAKDDENHEQRKKAQQEFIASVKDIYDRIRDKVIEPLVIRRTRTDIMENHDYREDIKNQGIVFPEIERPHKIEYRFTKKLSNTFEETVTILTGEMTDKEQRPFLRYFRYRAVEFLVPKHRQKYGDAAMISRNLSGIMKTLLIKRLESSFFAFRKSIHRLRQNTQNMIDMLENDKIYVAPDLDVNLFIEEGREEELEKKINATKDDKTCIYKAKDFDPDYIKHLKEDLKLIDYLIKLWDKVDADPKMEKFLVDLKSDILKKKNNPTGKVVIFTESIDTKDYVEKNLRDAGYDKIITVDSHNRDYVELTVEKNFDANIDERRKENDYDILITTEVLAEGINLHRANCIVNYDVPWNATKLMQRIGRVNRIGTIADKIHIFNFYPADHVNAKIHLTEIALKKLQAFHTALGEDSQIYSTLEEVGKAGLYGSELRQEKNETLTRLQFLRDFRRDNKEWFSRIKKLPNKARTTRKASNVDAQAYPIEDATLTFIKTELHPGVFYLIGKRRKVEELGFIEACQVLEAKQDEKSEKLPESHHLQVNDAKEVFQLKLMSDLGNHVVRRDLSPAENRSLEYLAWLKTDIKRDFYLRIVARAEEEILEGTFKSLPNDIDSFFRKNLKKKSSDPNKLAAMLYDEVLEKYYLDSIDNQEDEKIVYKDPEIILSESFIK